MNQNCPRCGKPTPDASRFCPDCGMTLGATVVQGRTVALPAMAPPVPPPQPIASIRSVGAAPAAIQDVGTFAYPAAPASSVNDRNGQRELTVFVEDISGSMASDYDRRLSKLEAAKRAACSMVVQKSRLDPQDEIGVVQFNDSARRVLHLCPIISHKINIIQAIQSLEVSGGTDINAGLTEASDMFEWHRHGVVRRIVLLTDGHGGYPLTTAEDLKDRGVVIDVVGVGEDPSRVNEKLLRKVASEIEGETRYRFIKDSRTLVDHYTVLANKTATR